MAETLFPNRRIVPLPNVGTTRNLDYKTVNNYILLMNERTLTACSFLAQDLHQAQ
jgi:hypothetical protein